MSFAKIAHRIANIPFIKRQLAGNRFVVRLYFNWRYRNEDPYDVTRSGYEKEKYARTMEALSFKDRFASVLEIGCGEGHLTEMLAGRADWVLAADISDLAISRAKKKYINLTNVEFRRFDVLNDGLEEKFELVLCSEVLFYFEKDQLPNVVERVAGWTRLGGFVALAHARALSDDVSGVELKKFGAKTIHELFINDARFEVFSDKEQPEYRITVVRKK